MRPFRPWLLLFVLASFAASLSAQQTASTSSTPATSDPQAVALLQQSLAALTSGVSVSDVTLTGTARRIAGSDDETGTATLKATATDDSRVDLSFTSGNRTEIRNHAGFPLANAFPPGVTPPSAQTPQPVGERIDVDGTRHGMARHNTLTTATWFFPACTIARLTSAPNYVLSYIGQENHNGQPTVHVSASAAFPINPLSRLDAKIRDLTRMDVFLDPATLLPVALDFNSHPDADLLTDFGVEIRFTDYRSVSGVEIPFHVQRYINNDLVLDLGLTDAVLNAGLSGTDFQIQ